MANRKWWSKELYFHISWALLGCWLNAYEFGWTPGVGDGQGGLVCCNSWGRKELDTTERLNWTELNGTQEHSPLWSPPQCVLLKDNRRRKVFLHVHTVQKSRWKWLADRTEWNKAHGHPRKQSNGTLPCQYSSHTEEYFLVGLRSVVSWIKYPPTPLPKKGVSKS